MAAGGFDVVLGNPPWDQILLNEEEWFAQRHPEIAGAANSAKRRAALGPEWSALVKEFHAATRLIESQAQFVRASGAFPLTGTGRINTYSLFHERIEQITAPMGVAGLVIPTGVLTDFSQAGVTRHLVKEARINIAFDFENGAREGGGKWFPDVHPQTHFLLLTFGGREHRFSHMQFSGNCVGVSDAYKRAIEFPPSLVGRVSPNTATIVLFQAEQEISIAEKMITNGAFLNASNSCSLGVSFSQPFNASSDSGQFRMTEDLGVSNVGPLTVLRVAGSEWWPLLEAKCGDQYNHRYGSYEGSSRAVRGRKNAGAPAVAPARLTSAETISVPRYWVSRESAISKGCKGASDWQLLYRFSAYPDNERTMIAWIAPGFPSTHITPRIILPRADEQNNPACRASQYAFLLGALNSLPFDFLLRRRMSRRGVDFFILKQIVIPKQPFCEPLGDCAEFFLRRVLELTYVAWDLQPFANAIGYDGPPFRWDDERRAYIRAELDAWYGRAYGLLRDDLRYILDPAEVKGPDYPSETFRVLKKNEIARFGEYRTARLVLTAWDAQEAQPAAAK